MSCIIFFDGASKGNPGRGGWGAIVATDDSVVELGGRQDDATNNQMELRAAIEGLKFAKQQGCQTLMMYGDSSYVLNGISKWVWGWQKNGWKTQGKESVLNKELWLELVALAHGSDMKVSWEHLGGHIGIAGNERVDTIASDLAEGQKVDLYNGPASDYTIDLKNLEHDAELHAAKTSSRSKSKRPAYSYVSEVDGVIQTHKTWAECEARVKGKKAKFKKVFSAEEEAATVVDFKK